MRGSPVARKVLVKGFHYTQNGEHLARTPAQWRQLFSTHTRRVEHGETYFINQKTKLIEYEAYAIISA